MIFSFIDPTWAPGVTRGDIEEYLDGRDIEDGADIQGGVRDHLVQIREVQFKRNSSCSSCDHQGG